MLGEKARCAIQVKVHPKAVQQGSGSGLCAGHLSSSALALADHISVKLHLCTEA